MGHHISAILLKNHFNRQEAEKYDLLGIALGFQLNMFFIDHYYAACWQHRLSVEGQLDLNGVDYLLFPHKRIIAELLAKISLSPIPTFAIISTDYFGGLGHQWANVYKGNLLADKNITTINQALAYLGVEKTSGIDEFDSVGLSKYRSMPDYLEKYYDWAEELGL